MACCNNCTPIRIKDKVCQICDFLSTNDCTGGIGATYAIRQLINNNDNTWTIDGAPEHTTAGFFNSTVFTPAGPFAQSATDYQISDELIQLTNPSACRSMRFLIVATSSMYLTYPLVAGNYYTSVNLQLRDNATNTQLAFALTRIAGDEVTRPGFSLTVNYSIVLAPSATQTLHLFNMMNLSIGDVNSVLLLLEYAIHGTTI